jgi:hypothetical protein
MIKKFEEFICESAYHTSIMRKIIKDMESVKQNYTEDKGPYMLHITHCYFPNESDTISSIRSYRKEYDRRNKNKFAEDMNILTMLGESNGKAMLTADDLDEANINDFIEMEDNEVLLYPFADYNEALKFIKDLESQDFDIYAFSLDRTEKGRRNPLLYFCRGCSSQQEIADDLMDGLMQLFSEKL